MEGDALALEIGLLLRIECDAVLNSGNVFIFIFVVKISFKVINTLVPSGSGAGSRSLWPTLVRNQDWVMRFHALLLFAINCTGHPVHLLIDFLITGEEIVNG
jgi:hypothetical protein